jgi:hypothetical protein
LKTKITPLDLSKISEQAISFYKDESPGDLSHEQFRAQCFLKASLGVLQINGSIEFPYRKNTESVDE